MKKQDNVARLGPVSWTQYRLKLSQLDVLFKFVMYAFEHLSSSKREGFVRRLKQSEQTTIAQSAEQLRKLKEHEAFKAVLDDKFIESFEKTRTAALRRQFRIRTHTQYAEWVRDGLISAEILFRFTMFEGFLKHVHAAILHDNPKLFSTVRPKREATYKEIFADSFERFKEQQICREVSELDNVGMKNRLDYFAEHLLIDLREYREALIEISDLRNKIAHGNPLEAITTDDTKLPLKGIQDEVAKVIAGAMSAAFKKAQEMYPRRFTAR